MQNLESKVGMMKRLRNIRLKAAVTTLATLVLSGITCRDFSYIEKTNEVSGEDVVYLDNNTGDTGQNNYYDDNKQFRSDVKHPEDDVEFTSCEPLTCYKDNDKDGFGTDNDVILLCECNRNYIEANGDCDDNNPNINPSILEICNNIDDNCNGETDENLTQGCNTVCGTGLAYCIKGIYQNCDAPIPSQEICDGLDNDCDNQVDEGCKCINGDTQQCGTSNIGECEYGTQTCIDGEWSNCLGAVNPTNEICDNKDNDCNSQTDENLEKFVSCGYNGNGQQKQICNKGNWLNSGSCNDPDVCKNGNILEQSCGSDVGECEKGIQSKYCNNGQWGSWGSCQGEVKPTSEICDGLDNDCDGNTDENLTQICYTACGSGIEECTNGSWKNCDAPQPSIEICDGADNDCDGKIDNIFENESIIWEKFDEAFSFYNAETDIVKTNDGNYLIAGLINETVRSIKIDPEGNYLWNKEYNANWFSDIERINNSGFIIAGRQDYGIKAKVIRIDDAGGVVWQKIYGDITSVFDIQQTGNDFFVVGSKSKSEYSDRDGWFFKINSSGQMVQESILKDFKSLIQLEKVSDGFISIGKAKDYGMHGQLVKFDPSGSILWTKYIPKMDGFTIVQTADQGYLIGGQGQSPNAWLYKVNSQGNLEWSKMFGSGFGAITKIIKMDSGDYLAVGGTNYGPSSTSMDGLIVKVNQKGDILFQKEYGTCIYDILSGVVKGNDGDFFTVGHVAWTKLWIMSLDHKILGE